MQTLVHTTNSVGDTAEPYVLLEVSGELDLDTQDGFEAAVAGHLGSSSVVLDMSRVEFLAIASLRSLLSCQSSAVAEHRHLVYADTPRQALRLLDVSGVGELLELSDTVDAAREVVTAG